MKTFLKVAAVVFILLLALPFMLQLRVIEVENGKTGLLYVPLSGGTAGGSVGADLKEALQSVYGEENVPVETAGRWREQDVIISDTYTYELEYIGKTPDGRAEYIECTIVTNRSIRDAHSDQRLAGGMRICVCTARNELGNEKRAYILWETMDENFHGSGFDAVPVA